MGDTVKYTLDEAAPEPWYNVAADLPEPPAPVLHPGRAAGRPGRSGAPLPDGGDPPGGLHRGADPDPRGGAGRLPLWRPTPLYRARRLEQELRRPLGSSTSPRASPPPGATSEHAVAPAFFNAREGVTRIANETGAGQWGLSLAFAGRSSASRSTSTWRRSRTTRSRTGARRRRPLGPAACQPVRRDGLGPRSYRAPTRPEASHSRSRRRSRGGAARRHEVCPRSALNHVLLHETGIGEGGIAQMDTRGLSVCADRLHRGGRPLRARVPLTASLSAGGLTSA